MPESSAADPPWYGRAPRAALAPVMYTKQVHDTTYFMHEGRYVLYFDVPHVERQ